MTYLTSAVSMSAYLQSTWRDVPALERYYAAGKFEALVRHHLVRIEPGACVVRPLQAPSDLARRIAADTVVLVTQNAPLRALYEELVDEHPAVFLAGDAHAPRDVQAAIAEGHHLGRGIP